MVYPGGVTRFDELRAGAAPLVSGRTWNVDGSGSASIAREWDSPFSTIQGAVQFPQVLGLLGEMSVGFREACIPPAHSTKHDHPTGSQQRYERSQAQKIPKVLPPDPIQPKGDDIGERDIELMHAFRIDVFLFFVFIAEY